MRVLIKNLFTLYNLDGFFAYFEQIYRQTGICRSKLFFCKCSLQLYKQLTTINVFSCFFFEARIYMSVLSRSNELLCLASLAFRKGAL